MKKLVFASVILSIIFMGCHTTPVVNSFMDPDLSVREHALVIVHNNIGVGMVDDKWTFKSTGAGTEGFLRSKTPILLLEPGEHSFAVLYYMKSQGPNSITTSQSNMITIRGNFLAGHAYNLIPQVSGRTVAFSFVEERDPNIWSNKKVASVKQPKKR